MKHSRGLELNAGQARDHHFQLCFNCHEKGHFDLDSLYLGNCELDRVKVFKLLGVWFQDNLCWNHHIEEMTKEANKRLFLLHECRKANLPEDLGITLYNTKIRSLLEYA